MNRVPLLIDTDPGVDDALAILMAHEHADVAALTVAAGNVGLGHTVRNARTLVDLLGARTPVFAGCPSPLVREPDEDAAFVHGADGFGDVGFAEPAHAADHRSRGLEERAGTGGGGKLEIAEAGQAHPLRGVVG